MRLLESIKEGRVYFIAEMSGNHGGSMEKALQIVDAAAAAGADCLKVQTYTADTITLDCDGGDFMTNAGLWEGRTLYDLYKEAYTPWEWQSEIRARCLDLGIDFLSSVFDKSSVDFLESIGADAYKIASFELVDIPLIRYAASKGKPMIISCGMGDEEDIDLAVEACRSVGNDKVVLLKCTSEYPAVYGDMNLATIPLMRERFGCPVGLSDHSMGDAADVAAVALGAMVIEKHFCMSRGEKTVDSEFSMEPAEFSKMVEDARNAAAAVGKPTFRRTSREEAGLNGRRSVYACADIEPGDRFTEENVRSVRPAYGLHPKYWDQLIGRTSERRIPFGARILPSDAGIDEE